MIWSALGQRIFKNRVSSISNDVRNYTVNLLHHYVIKSFIETDVTASKEIANAYPTLDCLAFKQACLLHLENLFVFSMLSSESDDIDTIGVLGAAKGRNALNADRTTLKFTHNKQSNLLVRQLTLGVSGRYKTPFIEMRFFDKEYRYQHPEYQKSWSKTDCLIESTHEFQALAVLLVEHLKDIVQRQETIPMIDWGEVPAALKSAYVNCFLTPVAVGKKTRDFWLNVTELDEGAAGCLYQIIRENNDLDVTPFNLFHAAKDAINNPLERQKVVHICSVEPLLAEFDVLFKLLLSERTQELTSLYDAYRELGRSVNTLTALASSLAVKSDIFDVLQGIAHQRYRKLLAIADHHYPETEQGFAALIDFVLEYHRNIMSLRGQSPWVQTFGDNAYRCNIKLVTKPEKSKRPVNSWNNRYYADEFTNLIRGLEGKRAEAQQ